MSGILLRSGTLREFKPLGVEGQPVYAASVQLREAIRLKIGREAADCLAIAQPNENGERIDWYAPMEGDVVPWSSATEDERAGAQRQLEVLHQDLRETAAGILGTQADSGNREKQLFAQLLDKSVHFPGSEHIYLVDGRPVVTFWGFAGRDGVVPAALPNLRAAAPATTASEPPAIPIPPAAKKSRRWWWWLLWLLLLILLLWLLLFVLRACAPRVSLPLGLGQIDLPGLPPAVEPDEHGRVILPDGRVLLPDGTLVSAETDAPAIVKENDLIPDPAPPEGMPALTDDAGTSTDTPPADLAVDANEAASIPQDGPEAGTAADAASVELHIPDQAIASQSTDFLNGRWWADVGIQDAQTGKPVQLQYLFNEGSGHVSVRRGDGVTCSGSVSAAIDNGDLAIRSEQQVRCTDGSQYAMPQVVCVPMAQSAARCSGQYQNQQFPLSMRQTPDTPSSSPAEP